MPVSVMDYATKWAVGATNETQARQFLVDRIFRWLSDPDRLFKYDPASIKYSHIDFDDFGNPTFLNFDFQAFLNDMNQQLKYSLAQQAKPYPLNQRDIDVFVADSTEINLLHLMCCQALGLDGRMTFFGNFGTAGANPSGNPNFTTNLVEAAGRWNEYNFNRIDQSFQLWGFGYHDAVTTSGSTTPSDGDLVWDTVLQFQAQVPGSGYNQYAIGVTRSTFLNALVLRGLAPSQNNAILDSVKAW